MQSLAGKTAVVTGGGSGLGAAMLDVFAGEGMNVVALDIDEPRAAATAASLEARGATAVSARVDVAKAESLRDAAALTARTFGCCDILCANVGVQQFGAIDRLTEQDWQWVLTVNVLGVVNTVATFLPLLRATAGDRHIVVTSSSSFFAPAARLGAYVTSKYAVAGYAETLRRELASEGINVTTLFPAGMSSRHLESSAAARPTELGESITLPDDISAMLESGVPDGGAQVATPEHAVRNLVRDLQEHRPYVITHGEYRGALEEYHAAILDAYDRMVAG